MLTVSLHEYGAKKELRSLPYLHHLLALHICLEPFLSLLHSHGLRIMSDLTQWWQITESWINGLDPHPWWPSMSQATGASFLRIVSRLQSEYEGLTGGISSDLPGRILAVLFPGMAHALCWCPFYLGILIKEPWALQISLFFLIKTVCWSLTRYYC